MLVYYEISQLFYLLWTATVQTFGVGKIFKCKKKSLMLIIILWKSQHYNSFCLKKMAPVWRSVQQTHLKTPEGGTVSPVTAPVWPATALEWETVTDAVAGTAQFTGNARWSAARKANMLMVRKNSCHLT